MYFKIMKSLEVQTDHSLHDFKGCTAKIIGKTSSYYFVQFHGGIPFLIDFKTFELAAEPIPKPNYMKEHIIIDISIIKGSKEIRRTRTIHFPETDIDEQVTSFLESVYKFSKGIHYDSCIVYNVATKEIINNKNLTDNTMARPKKVTTEVVQEAEVVETTINNTEQAQESPGAEQVENSVATINSFENQVANLKIPTIPETLIIGGLDFNLKDIKSKIAEVDKMVIKSPTDKLGYEALKKEADLLVKTRTIPEKWRAEAVKPINNFTKELKARTDSFGNAAKEAELRARAKMKVYEDHQEELERLEAERIAKVLADRQTKMLELGGIMNPASLHWNFPFDAGILIESSYLEEATDEEFNTEYNKILESKESFDKAAEAAKAAEEKSKNEAAAKIAKLLKIQIKYRTRDLEAADFKEVNGSFTKNGHTVLQKQIEDLEDEQWEELLENIENNPIQVKAAAAPAPATAGKSSTSFGFGFSAPASSPIEQTSAPEEPKAIGFGMISAPVTNKIEQPEEIAKPDLLSLLGLTKEAPYSEKPLGITTLRVYLTEYSDVALQIGNLNNRAAYAGEFEGTPLSYVVYKK